MLSAVAIYRLNDPGDLIGPVVVTAFDSWVDAGSASTTAADLLAEGGSTVITFDPDALFDYRARRPTLEIYDGRPSEITWPELVCRRGRLGDRDLLVLTGPEPDYRWREFPPPATETAQGFGVTPWVSLAATPPAVPPPRPV